MQDDHGFRKDTREGIKTCEWKEPLAELGYTILTADDKAVFDPYYDAMNRYWASSLSFLCINSWTRDLQFFYKRVGDLILCLGWDATEQWMTALPFFGAYTQESVNAAAGQMFEDFKAIDQPVRITDMYLWEREYYKNIPGCEWETIENRAHSDYIYKAEDFAAAINREKPRYYYNYFVRKSEPECIELSSSDVAECMALMDREWCLQKDCSVCDYGCPKEATFKAVSQLEKLGGKGVLVRSGGIAVGFCITTCRNGMADFQFKTTKNRLSGINEFLHKECFDRFCEGAQIINFAEDMGLPGLRTYKEHLAPYTLADRVTLLLKV